MHRPARSTTGLPIAFGLPLNFAAIIPDEIDRARMTLKPLAARGVFNPKFVGQNHGTTITCKQLSAKAAYTSCTPG
jgi:hypothetical protein